ncbi:heparan N-sulfatase, putative [Ixodes scapularis]|uniref:Heparan N-sulfatase, putative n=1 Tax=Ixodes scapularis TaxID=6945 RepID=B7PZX1_IXOSC|nr:heparan N-sulfatase, putative [Ixodes scapularis]|eukprot:XP_002406329.1 heparan N-sulfatase, putative [Ixodes scapularis]
MILSALSSGGRLATIVFLHGDPRAKPYKIGDLASALDAADILNRTRQGRPLPWTKTLRCYYYRDQWELFDLDQDPREAVNLAKDPVHSAVLEALQTQLLKWQQITHDPWMCAPDGVLQDSGLYKEHPHCFPLLNGL